VNFAGRNQIQTIRASDGVRLRQLGTKIASGSSRNPPQSVVITAPVIDFFLTGGKRLDRATTSGAPQITVTPVPESTQAEASLRRTVITAGRFEAKFAAVPAGETGDRSYSRLVSIHGSPDAKIVNQSPGGPDRVSTSETLESGFLPEGGISSIMQEGNVYYSDNQPPEKRTQAWAQKAAYTLANNVLVLNGAPRVSEGGMATTADSIRLDRTNGFAFADGNVKSTYSRLKEQPNGALLASSSPIHVTAASMTTYGSSAAALYQGNVRLWQDANVISAPSIQFDRNKRSLLAHGDAHHTVSTTLVQTAAKRGSENPSDQGSKESSRGTRNAGEEVLDIHSSRLTYVDGDRQAHYAGGVVARSAEFTATADTADAYLLPRSQGLNVQQLVTPSRLDRMVAQGNVVIQQPGRKAEGQKLVYTAADDKFVLTGGAPSIFDAEHGKITGDSLTFFRSGGRVLVEGEASTPVVTQTRMRR